jgi:putative ATP-dependent endonuclease of the OLD family
MRLSKIRIRNFRAFADSTISLHPYTCFVGPNGAGKSTVLAALCVFFKDSTSGANVDALSEEDFHCRNTADPIEITLHFCALSVEAQQEFQDYYRDAALVVSATAVFDPVSRVALVKQYGKRSGILDFAPFFKGQADGKKVVELQAIYARIRETYTALRDVRQGPAMTEQLRDYEELHPEGQTLIDSSDEFYGISGTGRLARYVQWVYIPAVKDASTEQVEAKNTALGKLLLRTARRDANFDAGVAAIRQRSQVEYQELLTQNQRSLEALSGRLNARMADWAHPEAAVRVEWKNDNDKAVRIEPPMAHVVGSEAGFEGALGRFGHGFQRSYLLALLQELAGGNDAEAPLLILGCEEPELYQHPPQARHLSTVLERLAKANAQVLVSTHSPLFVSGEYFEAVRVVRRCLTGAAEVRHVSFEDLAGDMAQVTGERPIRAAGAMSQIHQVLRPMTSEMFFAGRVVLVEGYEDAAIINAYMELLGLGDEFRRVSGHVVPVGCKSQLPWTSIIAKRMGIPCHVVCDADGMEERKRGVHEHDNRAVLRVTGQVDLEPFPARLVTVHGLTMWPNTIGDVLETEFGAERWARCQQAADRTLGQAGGMKKHSLHIGAKLAYGWDEGGRSQSLEALCRALVTRDSYLQ